ncbi:MAG: Unknown protein [uncultured Sulfurovum sp.]|uniref:Cadherin domain-containing protein n=1 Tax=uncultured Sulfurovum sp. TaxID=269237 RepID=A0A6S6U013_9BACT|nr:MAG: Unknown protein [uncultured Sulfurovum sp.]
MFENLSKKLFATLLILSVSMVHVSAEDDNNLSDTQLHAVMGIITNLILNSPNAKEIALIKIEAYASSGGSSATPTIGDYQNANVVGVDTQKLSAMNEAVASALPTQVDTQVELQAIVDGLIVHNGTTYGTVISPYTGIVWLDRNLGAERRCTTFDDAQCYGDYYQWGRNFDGHEDLVSGTTDIQAIDVNDVGHEDFITADNTYDYDWGNTADSSGVIRVSHWSTTDGSSVCPADFRVPTLDEFKAELFDSGSANIQNRDNAYDSFLKLPSAGLRNRYDGSMTEQGEVGLVWTISLEHTGAYAPYWKSSNVGWIDYYRSRANGKTVRCLKDYPDTTPPIFTSDDNTTVAENQTSAITLIATDANVIIYSIFGGESDSFDLNATTGVVTFKVAPDFETLAIYTFTAKATDASGNEVTQGITIEIEDVDEFIVYNGTTYGTVISPFTGKEWLDRNLGAERVCMSFDDAQCYGDYYQWGRNHDGHQERNSTTTSTQAADINNAGLNYVINSIDWASVDSDGSQRMVNWSATNGASVCPTGYRVPTLTEILYETTLASTPVNGHLDAFDNFLKLPSAGYRRDNGAMRNEGSAGYLWSSTNELPPSYASPGHSDYLYFTGGVADYAYLGRTYGFSVRCVKD